MQGSLWYVVDEPRRDVFFSAVFTSPLMGEGVFKAWAGGLPWDITEHIADAPTWSTPYAENFPENSQQRATQGCSWSLAHPGPSQIVVKVEIDEKLYPYDPDAIPIQYLETTPSEEDRRHAVGDGNASASDSQPESQLKDFS